VKLPLQKGQILHLVAMLVRHTPAPFRCLFYVYVGMALKSTGFTGINDVHILNNALVKELAKKSHPY
jgi:hypothetical protein